MSDNHVISEEEIDLKENLGTRRIPKVKMVNFPNADEIVRQGLLNAPRSKESRRYPAGEPANAGRWLLDPYPTPGGAPFAREYGLATSLSGPNGGIASSYL